MGVVVLKNRELKSGSGLVMRREFLIPSILSISSTSAEISVNLGSTPAWFTAQERQAEPEEREGKEMQGGHMGTDEARLLSKIQEMPRKTGMDFCKYVNKLNTDHHACFLLSH